MSMKRVMEEADLLLNEGKTEIKSYLKQTDKGLKLIFEQSIKASGGAK